MSWEQQEVFRILSNKPGTTYQEADDVNKTIIRDWLRSLLQATKVNVEFVKADGTVRAMSCTLNWEYIPEDKQPKAAGSVDGIVKESKQRKEPDPHTLKVFDLDKGEWRSFKLERVQKIGAEISFTDK